MRSLRIIVSTVRGIGERYARRTSSIVLAVVRRVVIRVPHEELARAQETVRQLRGTRDQRHAHLGLAENAYRLLEVARGILERLDDLWRDDAARGLVELRGLDLDGQKLEC